ncbi:MAG TPA: RsmE family RNA methyltransferase [Thermoanaerobaculia bacterium]|jgi:16S rRNA (uracil1498-N3)-methyltransferase|nr:RsmE family RNA methyltransferase [Thermoanaerobaculia bacterium]
MSLVTLLVEPAAFDGSDLRVEGDAYKHLFRARRLAAGDRVRVVDGTGRARWSAVTRIDRSTAVLVLGEPAPANDPPRRVDLLVPTLRPERASWLVEKATEIGVSAIRFLHTERAPRDFGSGTLGRLGRVSAAALEQCHGARLPALSGPHAWSELAALTIGLAERWALDTAADTGAPEWRTSVASAALLIGPEGGWSDRERQELRAAGWRAVGLGDRVLRAETAAVVGAAFLLARDFVSAPT